MRVLLFLIICVISDSSVNIRKDYRRIEIQEFVICYNAGPYKSTFYL